jgi:hypothetical protein
MIDFRKAEHQVLGIVVINVIVVLALTWLIVLGVVPLLTGVVFGWPALLLVDFLLIWRGSRRRRWPAAARRIPRRRWVALVIFTVSDIMVIASWIDKPSVSLAVQATIGTLVVGGAWYLVFRRGRGNRDEGVSAN